MRVDIEAVLARSLNLIIKPLSVRHLMYLSYPLRGMLRVSFIWDVMLHCTMGGPIMGGKHVCRDGFSGPVEARMPVLSENHIRTYCWGRPARIGMPTIALDRWTARCEGASFCIAKCMRT